jgi:hypothetical protein
MEKETLYSLLILSPLAGLFLGFLLGWGIRRSDDSKFQAETDNLRLTNRELSQDIARTQKELSRQKEIATKIPIVVKRLSGRVSTDTIPAIAVRFMKDFFHASQVGYFAPAGASRRTGKERSSSPTTKESWGWPSRAWSSPPRRGTSRRG